MHRIPGLLSVGAILVTLAVVPSAALDPQGATPAPSDLPSAQSKPAPMPARDGSDLAQAEGAERSCLPVAGPTPASAPPASLLQQLDLEIQGLARRIRPAVVDLSVSVASASPFRIPSSGRAGQVEALFQRNEPLRFSGTIIDRSGLVITSADAVRVPATRILVRLSDGRVLQARPIGASLSVDVGVVKIEGDFPELTPQLGDSSTLQPGALVVAVGNPFGLSGSVGTGVVSGLGRRVVDSSGEIRNLIQITAPVNPGDTGSPLVDSNGRVVAIVASTYRRGSGRNSDATAAASFARELREFFVSRGSGIPEDCDEFIEGVREFIDEMPGSGEGSDAVGEPVTDNVIAEGIHFAFPINDVKRAVDEILSSHLGPIGAASALAGLASDVPQTVFFGLRIVTVDEALAAQLGLAEDNRGVLVDEIVEGGPAQLSGVKLFDIILSIGGHRLNDPDQVREVATHVPPGRPVPIVLLRRASRLEVSLVPTR